MRYKVTGGSDGTSGIDVGSRRYDAGDIVEMTQSKAEWLIERGLLEPVSGRGSKAEPVENTEQTEVHNSENEPEGDDL